MDVVSKKCDRKLTHAKNGPTCGKPAKAITFGLNGVPWEADMCDEHRRELVRLLQPYTEIGRKLKIPSPNTKRAVIAGDHGTFRTAEVRAWLKAEGRPFTPTGRIARPILEEYARKHGL